MKPADASRVEALRKEIRAVDRAILEKVRDRLEAARKIGAIKRDAGLPLRNYGVEAEVIREARACCAELRIDPELGAELATLLIRGSLAVQEEAP